MQEKGERGEKKDESYREGDDVGGEGKGASTGSLPPRGRVTEDWNCCDRCNPQYSEY